MVVIENSVGINKKKDVTLVQVLLNTQVKTGRMITDGLCGSKTVGGILSYQKTISQVGSLMAEFIQTEELLENC